MAAEKSRSPQETEKQRWDRNFADLWNRRHSPGNDYYDGKSGRGYYKAKTATVARAAEGSQGARGRPAIVSAKAAADGATERASGPAYEASSRADEVGG